MASIFDVGSSALIHCSARSSTTGNNIANVNTEDIAVRKSSLPQET